MSARPPLAQRMFPLFAVLVTLWLLVVVGFSWLSGLVDAGCRGEEECSRIRTGWAVLMVLQLIWVAVVVVTWLRTRWRMWGLLVGLVLPPLTLLAINAAFYPPGSLFGP